MAKTNFQKRCEDCACLVIKDGKWCCDECFGQPIEEVDDCPEGITLEQLKELDKKAKEVKNVVTSADKPKKERKPRERKLDDVKVDFIKRVFGFISTFTQNCEIVKPEREINFTIGEDEYTLTLTKHRKPKAQK